LTSPNEITPTQLMRLIGTPAAPTIVDVCIDDDFAKDPCLIPTSIRVSHRDMPTLLTRLDDVPVVVTCQKGKKLSQGAAAYLRAEGFAAEYLHGGIYGWRDAGLPLFPASALPAPVNGARFLFGTTPFDIEEVFWSHRGEDCTFDTMQEEFKLQTDPLVRLANVVRAADTNRHDLASEAAGFPVISVGLSRVYKNYLQQFEAGVTFYDALCRWARVGQAEGHDCPTSYGAAQ